MSEEKLLFLLCFISETYQRKPNKNYFSSFSVFHTETECCTIMAIWGRRNVFSVYHMFLQTVVKVMFACSNVVVFCSLTGKKKRCWLCCWNQTVQKILFASSLATTDCSWMRMPPYLLGERKDSNRTVSQLKKVNLPKNGEKVGGSSSSIGVIPS